MTSTRLYEASAVNIDLDSEIKRLYYQANLNTQKEARALAQFGLRDGMSVLEIASGPGFVTEWLSGLVPNSTITCLEIDPILIERAEKYLKDKAKAPFRIVQGTVMKMDFPDNTFDFAYTRFLFEHLEHPVEAAKEIKRILKPGGIMVISEGDYAVNNMTDPHIEEVQPLREKLKSVQQADGGNVMIGRRLWPILRDAGLDNLDLEAIISHSGDKGLGWFYPNFNPDRLANVVKKGIISKEEEDVFITAVSRFMSSEDSFYMRMLIMARGQKPALNGLDG
jgi:ubiquinone/menaquinone biosynthesis C-methylase UbiE